jgi:hypothetical protein
MNAWCQFLVNRSKLKREANDVTLASHTNTDTWTPAVIAVGGQTAGKTDTRDSRRRNLARRPADDSEFDEASVDAAALLAEVEALRQRLAALEERLPRSAAADPPERRQAIRRPRPRSKTDAAELEPDAAARLARRRALGLGALASLFAFIGRSAARAADALMIDSSGVALFNGKRNLFTDEENAGNLRVCAASGVPGIYSEKGAVVVGSQNGNIWLNGKVGIGTATPAALLDVGGGLLHVAANVGTNPTVTSQGAYLGWNALTGNTGETDFINNQGGGTGGFAFMNTPSSGAPRTTLMVISGDGNVRAKSFDVGEDKGVQIEGTSGRNMFSDSEKAGSLRVGAWGAFLAFIRKRAMWSSAARAETFSWRQEPAGQALRPEASNLCAFFGAS